MLKKAFDVQVQFVYLTSLPKYLSRHKCPKTVPLTQEHLFSSLMLRSILARLASAPHQNMALEYQPGAIFMLRMWSTSISAL